MLQASSRRISATSTRNVITWSVWIRGFRNDPRFPPNLYHPSFSIGFQVQTSPDDTINMLRQKYVQPGQHVERWERFRAFSAFPLFCQEYCEDILAEMASKQDQFSVTIGQPFYWRPERQDLPSIMRLTIGPSPTLLELYASLSDKFYHIQNRMLRGATHHDSSKLPFRATLQTSPWRASPLPARTIYLPSVRICKLPERILFIRLNEIKEQYPDGFGEAKITGFALNRDARKGHFPNLGNGNVPSRFFPFRDFGKKDSKIATDPLVSWHPVRGCQVRC
jgi:hypothetical protein